MHMPPPSTFIGKDRDTPIEESATQQSITLIEQSLFLYFKNCA